MFEDARNIRSVKTGFRQNLSKTLVFFIAIGCEFWFMGWMFGFSNTEKGIPLLFGRIRVDTLSNNTQSIWVSGMVVHIVVMLFVFRQVVIPMYRMISYCEDLRIHYCNRKQN